MFYVGIAMLSIYAFSRIGVDLLPDVNIPHLLIKTNYPNASSEEVEKLVTQPLESTIATITSVKDISSVSQEGLSVISVDFAWGTNMDYAFLSTREKLDNIRFLLPDDSARPTIVRIDPSSTPIMSLIVTYQKDPSDKDDKDIIKFVDYDSKVSERKKLIDLKEISRVVFKRRLEQIDGVAQAVLTGGLERQIDVEINSDKLIEYNLTFNEIADALKNSNVSFPAGTILNGLFRYSLRTIGEFQNIDDIKNTIIKRNEDGSVFYLNDIATVKESFKEREGLTRFNGKESVGILIYKEPQSNTVDISGEVNNVVNQLNNEYP
jgi:HAE1 family hydrophobic/amphiphilic exporter-1